VNPLGVQLLPEPLGSARAARVAPAENRRQRVPLAVDGDEAVSETRDRVRDVPVQDTVDGGEDVVRIRTLVRLLVELAVGLATRLEVLGSNRGRPDVEREQTAQ
jgi:hypothetical protein